MHTAIIIVLASLLVMVSIAWLSTRRTVYSKLLSAINKIQMVDSHCHIPLPGDVKKRYKDKDFKYDFVHILYSTYIGQFVQAKKWAEIKEQLDVNSHTPYYRVVLEGLRDLYGLGPKGELNERNFEQVSKTMDACHRRDDWYSEVHKRAGIEHVVHVGGTEPDQLPAPYYHSVFGVDGLFLVTGKIKKGGKDVPKAVNLAKSFGIKLKGLGGMERLIEKRIGDIIGKGCIGIKTTAAYFRTLDFSLSVPKKRATGIFKKVLSNKNVSLVEQKDIEDYLFMRVLDKAAKLKCVFQFHTGNQQEWSILENCSPLRMNKLFHSGKYKDVKFVLLHGGYPFTGEAIMMAKYFNNVYLDLAWMPLFSPAAARQTISEAIDFLDGRKIMLGTDTANLEEQYGTTKFIRRVLADVLAEKVRLGYISEEAGINIARRIISTNAKELYKLK